MVNTEFIIIADEVLNGRIVDTNGPWFTTFCRLNGLNLKKISIVKDDETLMQKELERALSESDVVFTTGGLGPTKDDLTKTVVATLLETKIVPNELARELTIEQYNRLYRPWTHGDNDYDQIPEKAMVFRNPAGLAPGLGAKIDDSYLLCSPGVPREFHAMVEEVYLPFLREKKELSLKLLVQTTIRTSGVPEESIYKKIDTSLWENLEKLGSVSSLPQLTGVNIVITHKENKISQEELEKGVFEVVEKSPIKEYVWQLGELDLVPYVIDQCRKNGLTLCFAESCTGGLSASKVTDENGCSDVFLASFVTYANSAKVKTLGVKEETLQAYGAVSEQTALEMAIGARALSGSDIAVSFSGIAGPTGGTKEKPVGTVAIALASEKETTSEIYHFRGGRLRLKERFMAMGQIIILNHIKKFYSE